MQITGINNSAHGEIFSALDKQAENSLREQMPGIITRAIARVSVKNNLSDNMEKQSPLLGLMTNLATFISEQADTRGWYSLPQEILISRIALTPGDHRLDIKLNGDLEHIIDFLNKLHSIHPGHQEVSDYNGAGGQLQQ